MSYPVMSPKVPWGLLKSGFKKTPSFKTSLQKTATRRGDSAISFQPFASWDFSVDLVAVQGGEAVQFSVLQSFLGCFMACRGQAGRFLFTDAGDCTVDDTQSSSGVPQSAVLNVTPGAVQFGGPDGSSTVFQLARRIDQAIDILQNVSGVVVFVDGVEAGVSVGPTGIVTFASPPAASAVLAWQGSFQYLCRFKDDTLSDLGRTNKNADGFLWDCSSIAFGSEFV